MAASMMGAMLKAEDGEVSLIFRGGGITGNVICVGRQDGSVKGCIGNPSADLPPNENGKLPVGKAVGKSGTLTVVTDLRMKEPYVGQCALISGEIAEDLASYFAKASSSPPPYTWGVHMNSGGVTPLRDYR
jgi:molecular chaperone Hsp33